MPVVCLLINEHMFAIAFQTRAQHEVSYYLTKSPTTLLTID